jgi:hypothetical protein
MILKSAIAAAALFGATMLPASAMPIDNLAGAETANVEQVRTVCNPYGECWWQPGPRVYVAPRFYGGYERGYGRRYGGNGRYWGSPYQPRSWSR